jgi:hypothetical protein
VKTLNTVRLEAERYWKKGAYHREKLARTPWLGFTVPLHIPHGRDLLQNFEQLRPILLELQAFDGQAFHLKWIELQHRQLGEQRVPTHAYFKSESAWLHFIEKESEARLFEKISCEIISRQPQLLSLLMAKPDRVLQYAEIWPQLLDVTDWFIHHSLSLLYLRQIDLPGIDTKFIERHKTILNDLLAVLLPEKRAPRNLAKHGFERHYGLRFEEPLIRFRLLDSTLSGLNDLSVPASQFAALQLPIKRVFITENKVNGLAFPAHPNSLVIFGLGYGLESLFSAEWLSHVELYYWGDLDSHGFAMLARLRRHFPELQSILMDPETFDAHVSLQILEPSPITGEIPMPLTAEEIETYKKLQRPDGHFARIEQERIAYNWLEKTLKNECGAVEIGD